MRQLFGGLLLMLLSAHVSHSFEIDGLTSGISMDRARKKLEGSSYKNIQTKENGIIASGGNRFILLNFSRMNSFWYKNIFNPDSIILSG